VNCFECGADKGPFHQHHVVPRALGGTRTLPLCAACHGLIHGLDFTDHGLLIAEGLRQARQEGRRPGPAPYGWRKDGLGFVVPHAGEQAALVLARRLHAAGLGWAAVGRELRRKGHKVPRDVRVALDRSDEVWAERMALGGAL